MKRTNINKTKFSQPNHMPLILIDMDRDTLIRMKMDGK